MKYRLKICISLLQAKDISNFTVTPDGRYAYWFGSVVGLPSASLDGEDAILYDSVQNIVECVSCASSFNPEPKLNVSRSYLGGDSVSTTRDGTPKLTLMSADGSRAFFDTPSALVSSDIDGELESKDNQEELSPSSDVYEWRRNGLEGCASVQGCLSLVSSGRGGGFVLLLGADPSGRNVFFTTRESLVPQDSDTSIDIYDARAGGGFPVPPPRPVECEGDACQSPLVAPVDTTPASFGFSGSGNPPTPNAAKQAPSKPKVKPCSKGKVRRKGKCVKAKAKAKVKVKRANGRGRKGRGGK